MKPYPLLSTVLACTLALTLPVFAAEKMSLVSEIEATELQSTAQQSLQNANTTDTTLVLDLKTVVGLALAQNLNIQLAEAVLDQAKGERWLYTSGLLPSVRGSLFYERYSGSDIFVQENPTSVDRDTYRPRINFDYQIPLGGKTIFNMLAGKALKESKEHALDNTTQKAMLDSLVQYYSWLKDEAKIKAAEKALKQAEATTKTQSDRLKNGFSSQLDVEQANIQRIDRAGDVLSVKTSQATDSIILASLLNVPVEQAISATSSDWSILSVVEKTNNLSQLLQVANQQRNDLKDLNSQISAAKSQYNASFSDLLPTVALGSYVGGVGPYGELRNTYQRGVSLNLDMLKNLGTSAIGNIKTQRAKWQQAIMQMEIKQNEINKTIATTFNEWQYYQQRLALTEEKVKSSTEAERIAKARISTGFGIQLELLKAQADLAKAEQDYAESLYQANVAQLKLLYETGQLTPQSLGL